MRMHYVFREKDLSKWEPAEGMARGEEEGGPCSSVGVLGAGSVGKRVVENLVRGGRFPLKQILVSTRRPENVKDLEAKGVTVCFDNAKVAAGADVLVVACLPAHLNAVASSIREKVRETALVISLVAGVTPHRVAQLLRVRPEQVLLLQIWPHL
ncbi:hypothetical protein T484DRAFT_3368820 [Baffinella frigidus]|nr:hypothetical protein T484DRAFT_3368820 [Cryptophyta sp. CCMP2293]